MFSIWFGSTWRLGQLHGWLWNINSDLCHAITGNWASIGNRGIWEVIDDVGNWKMLMVPFSTSFEWCWCCAMAEFFLDSTSTHLPYQFCFCIRDTLLILPLLPIVLFGCQHESNLAQMNCNHDIKTDNVVSSQHLMSQAVAALLISLISSLFSAPCISFPVWSWSSLS